MLSRKQRESNKKVISKKWWIWFFCESSLESTFKVAFSWNQIGEFEPCSIIIVLQIIESNFHTISLELTVPCLMLSFIHTFNQAFLFEAQNRANWMESCRIKRKTSGGGGAVFLPQFLGFFPSSSSSLCLQKPYHLNGCDYH